MRRAVVALLVTVVAVVLLARYETHPPVTLTERTIPPAPPPRAVPGQRTADGPAMTEATRASLDRSGVPRRHVFTERFAL